MTEAGGQDREGEHAVAVLAPGLGHVEVPGHRVDVVAPDLFRAERRMRPRVRAPQSEVAHAELDARGGELRPQEALEREGEALVEHVAVARGRGMAREGDGEFAPFE